MKKLLILFLLVLLGLNLFVFSALACISDIECIPGTCNSATGECVGGSVALGEAAPLGAAQPTGVAEPQTAASKGALGAGSGPVQLKDPLGNAGVFKIINNIITALLGLTGVLAFVAFIYGGVLWMVSFGDPGKVEKGKKMIIWAVIGLIVVFSSYAILTLVFQAFSFTA